jgi:3-hydroxyisobutyrate dehydrogenase
MKISPQTTRVGWIGTGVMGGSMCGHVLAAGYPVTIYTRTRAKAEGLLAGGARWADTPRDVAAGSDVIFSIVGYPRDVREVLIGERGALGGCRPGCILVDMATSPPALSQEIAAAAAKQGVTSIDAPVTGGDVGARNGKLSIMIGGDAKTVAALEPFWQLMGAKWVHHGGPGAGQHAKIVNQILVCAHMIGLCESLLYAQRSGLDLEKVFESVASGAAGSWALSNLGPRIMKGDYAPGFFAEHLRKDIGLAHEEARRMDLKLPGLELAERLYDALIAQGHSKDGTQSLILALAQMSGHEWKPVTKPV